VPRTSGSTSDGSHRPATAITRMTIRILIVRPGQCGRALRQTETNKAQPPIFNNRNQVKVPMARLICARVGVSPLLSKPPP
jgi:hypothetical protein